MERIIKRIINKLSNAYGDNYLEKISHAFINEIDADYVFIANINDYSTKSETIHLVNKTETLDNFEYDLINTPCQNVLKEGVCCYPSDVCLLFPLDQLLIDMGIDGYLGIPLKNSKGEVTGLIVALYENEIKKESLATTLFELFAGRISAEIERDIYERKLKNLNEDLEQQVIQRTKELKDALTHLEEAKNKIVESEKIAALSKIVIGVAHEVNTPLGIAITTHSVIQEDISRIATKLDENNLKKSDLLNFCDNSKTTLQLQGNNLFKARELIEEFKKTSIETSMLEKENINISTLYHHAKNTMEVFLESKGIEILINSNITDNINSYPMLHNQVLMNLINNSIIHGFSEEQDDKTIIINIKELSNKNIQVDFIDNGKGIKEENYKNIFEPFFTTIRGNGGTGLGLSTVYNIVSQQFKGSISVIPSIKGLHLRFTISD